MQLKEVDKNIWTYEGSTVNFHGFPYSTRVTVIQLRNSHLWIHSPEKLNEALKEQLAGLGTVVSVRASTGLTLPIQVFHF
jgi:hypothetical protein